MIVKFEIEINEACPTTLSMKYGHRFKPEDVLAL